MNSSPSSIKLMRMKRLATGLLVAVAVLFVVAKTRHDVGPWMTFWEWVAAFAEAAMVGALADWFAVVALFRRPLGLPIPHTAVLPRNKARVADALAIFVRDKFLGTAALLARLPEIDPARRLGSWLAQPENARVAADRIAGSSVELLGSIDNDRIKAAIFREFDQRLQQLDVGRAAARLLDLLMEDNRHQLLLNEGIRRASVWLDKPEVQQLFAERIMQVAGSEYPKMLTALGLFGVNPDELGMKLAGALVKGFNRWLHDIGDDPTHERRRAFDAAVAAFVERLKSDEAFRERLERAKRDFLAHPGTRDYVDGLWDGLRNKLEADLVRQDSNIRAGLAQALMRVAGKLTESPALCAMVNEQVAAAVEALAPQIRETIARHIANTVREWDDKAIAFEVESSVGSDLQFIRINGTVVGGLVGLAIHAAVLLLGVD